MDLPWPAAPASKLALAFGGVVVDPVGRVLLREVKNHFDGYVWTFAKGRPNDGESPRETALREVIEETGVCGRILAPIPGDFLGGTTANRYFLMIADERESRLSPNHPETSQVRWVDVGEARDLLGLTTNPAGRTRDLAVLDAALDCLPKPLPLQRPITRREDLQQTHPLPKGHITLALDRLFTQAEMARIHRGFLPYVMEEKWFVFYEDGTLHFHRSWTGYCIFRVHFSPERGGWRAHTVKVNRDREQYTAVDDAEDRRRVLDLIDTLLINGPDRPTEEAIVLSASRKTMSESELQSLGFTDAQLVEAYRDTLSRSVVVDELDEMKRREIFDLVCAAWFREP